MSRTKKQITGLLPRKQWVRSSEICSLYSISKRTFERHLRTQLSVMMIGAVKLYRVSDVEKLTEQNILINHK